MNKNPWKVLVLILVLALAVASLAGCQSNDPKQTPDTSNDKAAKKGSITVFNWYDYIDEAMVTKFTEDTGYDVKYVCFTTVEEMYAKITAGGGAYDVIFPSDYIIERMIKNDGLVKLDKEKIPNFKNVTQWLQSPSYDPDCTYSVPYLWGTVGILYNTDLVEEEITSWANMFDPKYQSAVFMLDSYRDSLMTALCYLGYDMNTKDANELAQARDVLIKQKADGIVKGYLVDETKDKMINGEGAMALMWSGDALYAIIENDGDNLHYVVPSEGSNVWVDGMCIPSTSTNVEGAHALINFLCEVDVARANMDYIYYSTPNQGVIDTMSEEERTNLALNPTQDIIDRCDFFHDTAEFTSMYEEIWVEIRN